jgi:hypothetical protein
MGMDPYKFVLSNKRMTILNHIIMKKRVKIPRNKPSELLELAKKVQQKHLADGDSSVLKVLNWKDLGSVVDESFAAHEKAERLKREMLEAYQQRDLRLESVLGLLRDSRDVLTGAYSKEMKVLGQWGYDVAEIRRAKSAEQPAAAANVH